VIDLGSEQVIEHIHGGGEQHALIGLTGAPSDEFSQKSLAHTGIADQHEIGAFVEERQIEQTQDARLGLLAALVMEEVKGIDAGLRLQTRAFEAAVDGALFASFQFHVGEPLQGGRRAEVLGGCFSQSRLQLAAYGGQAQLVQFLFQRSHRVPFRDQG